MVFPEATVRGFTKATVRMWHLALEARGVGAGSIDVRIAAARKLGVEAADNGLLAPEWPTGFTRVKALLPRASAWELAYRQAGAHAAQCARRQHHQSATGSHDDSVTSDSSRMPPHRPPR